MDCGESSLGSKYETQNRSWFYFSIANLEKGKPLESLEEAIEIPQINTPIQNIKFDSPDGPRSRIEIAQEK